MPRRQFRRTPYTQGRINTLMTGTSIQRVISVWRRLTRLDQVALCIVLLEGADGIAVDGRLAQNKQ